MKHLFKPGNSFVSKTLPTILLGSLTLVTLIVFLTTFRSDDIVSGNFREAILQEEKANNYIPITPITDSSEFEVIAVLGTSDIHGHILPSDYTTEDTDEKYKTGGFLLNQIP